MKKVSILLSILLLFVTSCNQEKKLENTVGNTEVIENSITEERKQEIVVDASGITEGDTLDVSIIATFEPLAENEVLAWETNNKILKIYAQNKSSNTSRMLIEYDDNIYNPNHDTDVLNVTSSTLKIIPSRKIAVVAGFNTNSYYYINGEKGDVRKISFVKTSNSEYIVPLISLNGDFVAYRDSSGHSFFYIVHNINEGVIFRKIDDMDWIANSVNFSEKRPAYTYDGIVRAFFRDNTFVLAYAEGVSGEGSYGYTVFSNTDINLKTGEIVHQFDETTIKATSYEESIKRVSHGILGDTIWQNNEVKEATQKAKLGDKNDYE